ncbi:hypothetical protein ACK386_17670, partial [Aeromonas veronii]
SDCFRFSFGAGFARKLAHQFGVFRRAVLVGAHYREPRRDDKRKTAKNGTFYSFPVQPLFY